MGVLMLLSAYFLSFTLTESRISKSQTVGTQAYYLAEAGINKAIWKLKFDDTTSDGDQPWKTCFVATDSECSDGRSSDCNATWTASFTTNTDSLISNSTITVTIQSPKCAEGEITAISSIALGEGKTAQRIVKTKVIRDLGSLTVDSPVFSGSPSGETTIKNSVVNIYNGNIYIKNNLSIQTGSNLNVYDDPATDKKEGRVLVVGNILHPERINASGKCGADICQTPSTCECTDTDVFPEACQPTATRCPPKDFDMPPVDFSAYHKKAEEAQKQGQCSVVCKNSAGNIVTTSSKCIFSEKDFADLLNKVGSGGTLILEHLSPLTTYYVEGGISLGGERHLEVNGVLVADKTVNIGTWANAYLVIKDPGKDIPSGLLTQGKINFDTNFLSWYEEFDVEGLIYSVEEIDIDSILHTFIVKGGIIGRKIDIDNCQLNPLNIYLDNRRINEGIWGGPTPPPGEPIEYSPVITIEHWEEEY
jgi:hypothetical protein